ncbi:MAG: response regulator [Nitrospirae bacterium]|nr:response regulator [Nitrospirota bacterium]
MGKKVLIAESDSTVLQVISYFLKLEGFDISTVSDGTVALDVATRFMPDVILLDPGLSGVNGIEVSRAIRNRPEFPEFKYVPILYVIENMDALLKTGEDIPPGYGIIYKPIDPTKMVNTIKDCMEASSMPSYEQVEPMGPIGIEELLGWNVSEESKKDVNKKDIILENESAVLNDNLAGIAGVEEIEEQIPAEINEVAMEEIEKELEQTGYVSTTLDSNPIPTPALPLKGREFITTERAEGDMSIPLPQEEETTGEQMESESPLPFKGRDRVGMGLFPDEIIEKMLSKISREFIEKIVMDVVPRIAEEEVKKEIERLKGESG